MDDSISADRSCAIIVTYHPCADDLRSLPLLKQAFPAVVVIDNGSAPGPLAALRQAVAASGAELVENGENLGVATALNRGMGWARAQGFERAFLFDQDSLPLAGFATAMLSHYHGAAHRERLGIVSPDHLDRIHRTVIAPRPGPGGNPITITSGALLPMAVYEQVGPFTDALFIDEVDTEYCLRLCKRHYRIEVAAQAQLLHSLGNSVPATLFGKRIFTLTNHNSLRRYYSVRNRIWIIRHYAGTFPGFSLGMAKSIVADVIKVVLGETEKRAKLSKMLRGARDGLAGRGGPYA
jgi:rhamnosyltransferase